MKNGLLKVLSAVMALMLVIGTMAPAAAAVGEQLRTAKDDDVFHYVSLGASNTNGYGLSGYLPTGTTAAEKNTANVYGYQRMPEGSYPYLIAQTINSALGGTVKESYSGATSEEPFSKVHVDQLAMSSMRAEELRFLLDDTYEGDAYTAWRFYDENGNGWFKTAENDLQTLREKYAEAIANADLITLDIGINNFGVFMDRAVKVDPDKYVDWNKVDPEIAEKYTEAKTYIRKIVAENGGELAQLTDDMDTMIDAFAYTLVGFCTSFDVIMEKIYELNPDAKVVVVDIQCMLTGLDIQMTDLDATLPLGDIFAAVINAANLYTAVGSPYSSKYHYADVRKAGRVEFFVDQLLAYDGTLDQDMKDCLNIYGNEFGSNGFEQWVRTCLNNAGITDSETVASYLDIAYDALVQCLQEGVREHTMDMAALNFPLTSGVENVLVNFMMEFVAQALQQGEKLDLNEVYPNGFYEHVTETIYSNFPVELDVRLVKTIACFGIRTGIGNSFYSHPNRNGHRQIADAVLSAMEDEISGADVAIEEAVIAAKDLVAFVKEHYDEAYAYGYQYAVKEGYIDAASAAIDEAIAAIESIDVSGTEMTAEFQAELNKELAAMVATLEEVKAGINSAATVEELLAAIMGLEDDLYTHLANVKALALQAGTDIDQLIMIPYVIPAIEEAISVIENEVIPAVEAAVKAAAEQAYAYLVEKLGEAYDYMVNAAVAAFNKYAPEAADAVYDWLYNNPETVIEFFATYGDDMIAFVIEHHEAILSVLGFIAVNYGEDIINLIIDNADVIFPALVRWYEIHGENTWALIKVYLDALGLTDPALWTGIMNELVELMEKYGQLVADKAWEYIQASGILEEIEAKIAEIEAIIGQKLDQLRDQIENVKAQLEVLKKQLEEAIESGDLATVKQLEKAIAAMEAVLEQLQAEFVQVKAELDKLVAQINGALHGEYTVNSDSVYVAITGTTDGYAPILAEKLKLPNKPQMMTWNSIDDTALAGADLITIGYGAEELGAFATNQMFGYIHRYIDTTVRESVKAYLKNVLTVGMGGALTDSAIADYVAMADAPIDEILANELLAGKTATALDWGALVGEDNAAFIDKARAELKAALLEAGIKTTYTLEINLLDYLFEDPEIAELINREALENTLGEDAIYTVELPVAEFIDFAAESYLYNYIRFSMNYAQIIATINAINSDAVVMVLGSYNPFGGLKLDLGEKTIDLGAAYEVVAAVSEIHSLSYALAMENVIFVDIQNNDEANIAEQIAQALTVTCGHWDHNNDHLCDRCGETISRCIDSNGDNKCDICGKPMGTVEPTDPTEPTEEPTEPSDPTEPVDPTEPTDKTDASTPSDPEEPTDPDQSDPGEDPGEEKTKQIISVVVVVAVVIGSVAVIAGIGTAAYFYLKKKTFTTDK